MWLYEDPHDISVSEARVRFAVGLAIIAASLAVVILLPKVPAWAAISPELERAFSWSVGVYVMLNMRAVTELAASRLL
jgi:hypothetical protein